MPMWDAVSNASQWFPNEMDTGTEAFSHGSTPVKHILLKETKEKQNTIKCVADAVTWHSADLNEVLIPQ